MVQSEIDAAAAFMEKVCTSDVYWAGIKDTNTAKDDITADLHPLRRSSRMAMDIALCTV